MAGRPTAKYNSEESVMMRSALSLLLVLCLFCTALGQQPGAVGRPGVEPDGTAKAGGQVVSPPFNVRTYGAKGDGTNDDTGAFNSAVAACNAAGGGVIYAPRPPAHYKVTSKLTTITAPCAVRGDGSGSSPSAVAWATKIVQTSRTADLFTVTADSASFEGLYLFNSNSTYGVGRAAPATPPTAGAAVKAVASSSSQRVNLDDVVVEGFYDNVRQDGAHWVIGRSHLVNAVRYNLYVTNSVAADAGDWAVSDTQFSSKTYLLTAHVRVENAGGGKLSNVKMNAYDDPAIPGATGYATGLSVNYTATSVLLLSNVSIENYASYAINATGVSLVGLSNVQVGDYVSAGSTPAVLLTNCTDVNLASVILRSTVSPTQVGIRCDSCTRVTPGSLLNDGFLDPLQLTTAYTTNYKPLALAAGWSNTGAPFDNAGYWFNSGRVCLRGMVSYGRGGTTTISTLPAHIRPSGDKVFPGVANGSFQRIRLIASTGAIQQEGGGPTSIQSLDGICYDVQ